MSIELAIFDVDDVVIDMDEAAQVAEGAVRERLRAHLSLELADRVAVGLGEGYDVLLQQLRGGAGRQDEAHERLLSRLRWWQRGAIERGFEFKVFSRHTLLAAALEAQGVPVTAAIINDVVDAYWAAIRDASVILEDARWAIERCRALGAHVHLATNSDGFLIFDEAAQTFHYDPEDAVKKKRAAGGAPAAGRPARGRQCGRSNRKASLRLLRSGPEGGPDARLSGTPRSRGVHRRQPGQRRAPADGPRSHPALRPSPTRSGPVMRWALTLGLVAWTCVGCTAPFSVTARHPTSRRHQQTDTRSSRDPDPARADTEHLV